MPSPNNSDLSPRLKMSKKALRIDMDGLEAYRSDFNRWDRLSDIVGILEGKVR